MDPRANADDARQSLNSHAAAAGRAIYEKYGPRIGWSQLLQILEDRSCARYPCAIVFDAGQLDAREFANPVAKGSCPEEGFIMYVHPLFLAQREEVPLLVLYQLVLVNYGECASADDAETFGAAALGLSKDEYYEKVCRLADLIED